MSKLFSFVIYDSALPSSIIIKIEIANLTTLLGMNRAFKET